MCVVSSPLFNVSILDLFQTVEKALVHIRIPRLVFRLFIEVLVKRGSAILRTSVSVFQ